MKYNWVFIFINMEKTLINPIENFKYVRPTVKELFEDYSFLFSNYEYRKSYYKSETNELVLVEDDGTENILSEQKLEKFYKEHKQWAFESDSFYYLHDKSCIPVFNIDEWEVDYITDSYDYNDYSYLCLRHIKTGLYVTAKYVDLNQNITTIRVDKNLNTYYFYENN